MSDSSPSRRTVGSPPSGAGRSSVGRWQTDVLEFLYPPACLYCGASLPDGRPFCHDCCSELAPPPGDVCQRCCAPVGPHLKTEAGCFHCRQDRFAFDRVRALGVYRGPLQIACLRAKQDRSGALAGRLAELLIRRWGESILQERYDLIVPVPAHWTTRLRRTGFPADAIAAALSRSLSIPWSPHVLRKVRRTPPQASLPPTQRRENLKGAFGMVSGVGLVSARVLLVDDVLTTGATAHRTAQVLLQHGADRVSIVVLARGLGE